MSREDLGEEGTGGDLIGRLADRMSVSNAKQASVTRDRVVADDVSVAREAEPAAAESRIARVLGERQTTARSSASSGRSGLPERVGPEADAGRGRAAG